MTAWIWLIRRTVCPEMSDITLLRMGTNTINVSKNISISDEVYRRLKREKGDRSFSEVIAAKLEGSGQISEVAGMQVLEPETYENVSEEIERLSEGTMRRTTE